MEHHLPYRLDMVYYFNGNWSMLRQGFDEVATNGAEYYIGNEAIYQLTSRASYILRIDMWTDEETYEYAEYDGFALSDEANNYTLTLTNYRGGSAGPGGMVTYHSGRQFRTTDRDSADLCAEQYESGWWYMERTDIIYEVWGGKSAMKIDIVQLLSVASTT